MLEAKVKAFGVRTLSWIHVTRSTIITSNAKPVIHPGDFQGLTIATMNGFSGIPFEVVGAKAIQIYSPEIYAAILAGKASAIMTDVSSATGLRFAEIQKYGTVAPFFSAYYHLFVNPKVA